MSSVADRNVLAFDIGGTWLRSALVSPAGALSTARREPTAALRAQANGDPRRMANALVDYLVRVRALHPEVDTVGISLGAVYDMATGVAVSSAPLWGAVALKYPIHDALTNATDMPTAWAITNDVSAMALAARAQDPILHDAPFHLFTLSSGVAARRVSAQGTPTTDHLTPSVQGEIGHLPAHFEFQGRSLDQFCECGGVNHYASFLSGRGFANLLRSPSIASFIEERQAAGTQLDDVRLTQLFLGAADEKEPWAVDLIRSLAATLLDAITWVVTLDPAARIVLAGGFFQQLEQPLSTALLTTSETVGPYSIGDDPSWLRSRFSSYENPNGGLVGASLHAMKRTATPALDAGAPDINTPGRGEVLC